MGVAGLKGESARDVLPSVRYVRVALESAKEVFYTSTLPKYAKLAKATYPGVEDLPADAQVMLLSLVFNRGARMSGSSRREMMAIQLLVTARDLGGIAEQIRSMKRLWDESVLPGLHVRRDKEAEMTAYARTEYDPHELVLV